MYSQDDYPVFIEKLESRFPKMFAAKYGGVDVGAGWWHIVECLCANIQYCIDNRNKTRQALLADNPYNVPVPDEIPQVVVAQIKEKFGGLRFYYDGGDDKISGLVCMAESWAYNTCETCGQPGELRHDGWLKTLCDRHAAERAR